MLFLQERHSDSVNESEWLGEWKGHCVFSHGFNVSTGVAVLFFPEQLTDILMVSEEIQEHADIVLLIYIHQMRAEFYRIVIQHI